MLRYKKVISNARLIATMMPVRGNGFDIKVLFTRSVDPKTDPVSKWQIKLDDAHNVVGDSTMSCRESQDSEEDEFEVSNAVCCKADSDKNENDQKEEESFVRVGSDADDEESDHEEEELSLEDRTLK